jgi:hypothetical protein
MRELNELRHGAGGGQIAQPLRHDDQAAAVALDEVLTFELDELLGRALARSADQFG